MTSKTTKRTAQKVKSQMLSSSGETKRKLSIKYSVIEEKVVASVNLLWNRTKPLPVTVRIVKEHAEQVAQMLGKKRFLVGKEGKSVRLRTWRG